MNILEGFAHLRKALMNNLKNTKNLNFVETGCFFFTFHKLNITLVLELKHNLFHYMQCPTCQNTDSRVLESRSADTGKSVRRRRECLNCSYRFTTYERVETIA